MNSISLQNNSKLVEQRMSIHAFGEMFIKALPSHIQNLKIPGQLIEPKLRRPPILAQIDRVTEIQTAFHEVLCHSVTQDAHRYAERAFKAFLEKDSADTGVLKFFNGWNETHKTTSLVSAKVIMRLAADVVYMPQGSQACYCCIMAHMHEVAKDDFGLGHHGHDGTYTYMTAAFDASDWAEKSYSVHECDTFSEFLYNIGVAEHKSAMHSCEHKHALMDAMMVAVASELWNGREYNFIAQYIEEKLRAINFSPSRDDRSLRYAKSYVMGHSGEVENRHGLHALAAAQAFARMAGLRFDVDRLKDVMLDYNQRVGRAFRALHEALN